MATLIFILSIYLCKEISLSLSLSKKVTTYRLIHDRTLLINGQASVMKAPGKINLILSIKQNIKESFNHNLHCKNIRQKIRLRLEILYRLYELHYNHMYYEENCMYNILQRFIRKRILCTTS